MADQEQLTLLGQGVETWNRWREERSGWEQEESLVRWNGLIMSKHYPHVVDLSGANLEGWELPGVNLQCANLQGAQLGHANLQGALLKQADLCDAHLTAANLQDAVLDRSNLERAELDHAVLFRASLTGADLWKASLRNANLVQARCVGAFLAEVDLSRTALAEANFTWAVVYGADFSDASLGHTIFGDVDLSEVKGLETTHHGTPSVIDIRTLARSSGHIPASFLEQAGIDPAVLPSLFALFHGYHGREVWWSSEEPRYSPWQTGERPQEPPQPMDEDTLPDLGEDL